MPAETLRAGRMDRRITLQRAALAANGFNEDVETWSTLATVAAEVIPVSDGERVRAAEVAAQIEVRFRIRYAAALAALDAQDRVLFDGRTYNIHAVKEIGRRAGLEISASARSER